MAKHPKSKSKKAKRKDPGPATNQSVRTLQLLGQASKHDGWSNILTGIGIRGRDKRISTDFKWEPLSEGDVEQLYASDKIARRVVEIVPKEGTRKWLQVQVGDEDGGQDLAKLIMEEHDRLRMRKKVKKAWTWARHYGGAGIFIAVDDGRKLDEPLDLANIRSVRALTVLNRYELSPFGKINDLGDPDFGEPEFYSLNPREALLEEGITKVHHTRIVRFEGETLPRNLRSNADDWGDSVLTAMLNVLRNFHAAHDASASAAQDFRINVLKLKNLADIVASDDEGLLQKRIEAMNMSKSVLNSILLDADSEEYENKATNFTGLEKLLGRINDRLVAEIGMPHTIILGDGSTGSLSGKGESEEKNFKSFVAGEQEDKASDPVDRLFEVMLSARKGPTGGQIPETFNWLWNPIWEPSDKEVAEVRKSNAEADSKYIEAQVLDPDEVATSRFGGVEYGTEITLNKEARAQQAKTAPLPTDDPDPDPDPKNTDELTHIHWDGGGFTGPLIDMGGDHIHNDLQNLATGQSIPLPGGGHYHQKEDSTFTGPNIPLDLHKEIMVTRREVERLADLEDKEHEDRIVQEGGQFCVAPHGDPPGRQIATGSANKTLNVWDAETGQAVFALRGHIGPVTSVAFSPDGRRIVCGSNSPLPFGDRGELNVWDSKTGQKTLTIKKK